MILWVIQYWGPYLEKAAHKDDVDANNCFHDDNDFFILIVRRNNEQWQWQWRNDQLPPPTRKAPPVNQTITGNGSSLVSVITCFNLHYRIICRYFLRCLHVNFLFTPILPQRDMYSQVEAVFIASSNLLFKMLIITSLKSQSWLKLENITILVIMANKKMNIPKRDLIAVSVKGDRRPLLRCVAWLRPARRSFRPDKPIFPLKSSLI